MLGKNQSIQSLVLSSNMIKSEGAWIILNALKINNSLIEFDVAFNNVTKEDYSALVSRQMLDNMIYRKNHLNFLFCAYLSSKKVHFEGNILRHLLFPLLDGDADSMQVCQESA
jgi:hypothetical protein